MIKFCSGPEGLGAWTINNNPPYINIISIRMLNFLFIIDPLSLMFLRIPLKYLYLWLIQACPSSGKKVVILNKFGALAIIWPSMYHAETDKGKGLKFPRFSNPIASCLGTPHHYSILKIDAYLPPPLSILLPLLKCFPTAGSFKTVTSFCFAIFAGENLHLCSQEEKIKHFFLKAHFLPVQDAN